jgi:hypothetical protein
MYQLPLVVGNFACFNTNYLEAFYSLYFFINYVFNTQTNCTCKIKYIKEGKSVPLKARGTQRIPGS